MEGSPENLERRLYYTPSLSFNEQQQEELVGLDSRQSTTDRTGQLASERANGVIQDSCILVLLLF
jgi:hypothetical protein